MLVYCFLLMYNILQNPGINDYPLSKLLTAVEGDHWRHIRNHLTPTFSSGKLRKVCEILIYSQILLNTLTVLGPFFICGYIVLKFYRYAILYSFLHMTEGVLIMKINKSDIHDWEWWNDFCIDCLANNRIFAGFQSNGNCIVRNNCIVLNCIVLNYIVQKASSVSFLMMIFEIQLQNVCAFSNKIYCCVHCVESADECKDASLYWNPGQELGKDNR